MSYCPHCGVEIQIEETRFCPACGGQLDTSESDANIRKTLMSHLSYSTSLVRKHPILLIPELIAVIITYLLGQVVGRSAEYFNLSDWFSQWLGTNGSKITAVADYSDIPSSFWLIPIAVFLWILISAGVSGLFSFQTLHMAWRASTGEPVNLADSFNYLRSRLGKFFLAAIIANIFSLTFIMLPAALFMYSVMIVDFVGIREGLSKGFRVQMDRILSSIGLIILYYVSTFALGLIPVIGIYLRFLPSAIIEIASLDLYMNYKHMQSLSRR
jgi:hypothetical protein